MAKIRVIFTTFAKFSNQARNSSYVLGEIGRVWYCTVRENEKFLYTLDVQRPTSLCLALILTLSLFDYIVPILLVNAVFTSKCSFTNKFLLVK